MGHGTRKLVAPLSSVIVAFFLEKNNSLPAMKFYTPLKLLATTSSMVKAIRTHYPSHKSEML